MENDEMKKCQYCAELIKAEAIKCRYCGSNQPPRNAASFSDTASQFWRRVNEDKKIAGVCTGIARQFDAPILVLPLRLVFIATTFLWLFGLICYIILWILMPPPIDQPKYGEKIPTTPPPTPSPVHPPVYENSRPAASGEGAGRESMSESANQEARASDEPPPADAPAESSDGRKITD